LAAVKCLKRKSPSALTGTKSLYEVLLRNTDDLEPRRLSDLEPY